MYLGLLLTICAGVLMSRIADYEKRNGWIWGLVGALCMLAVLQFMAPSLWSLLLGFGAAFGALFAANLLRKDRH